MYKMLKIDNLGNNRVRVVTYLDDVKHLSEDEIDDIMDERQYTNGKAFFNTLRRKFPFTEEDAHFKAHSLYTDVFDTDVHSMEKALLDYNENFNNGIRIFIQDGGKVYESGSTSINGGHNC